MGIRGNPDKQEWTDTSYACCVSVVTLAMLAAVIPLCVAAHRDLRAAALVWYYHE